MITKPTERYGSYPECPWCGTKIKSDLPDDDGEGYEFTCDCGKIFLASCYVKITYTSIPAERVQNDD